MKIYTIRDWDKNYENSRSRAIDSLSWVPIPNRHDGENFSCIMANKNGHKIFSAWILMLQVASRCEPRGRLIRANGQPHTAETLSIKTRAPAEWFELAFDFIGSETDWLECEEFTKTVTSGGGADDRQVIKPYHPSAEEEKRIEGKEQNEQKAGAPLRFQPQLDELQAAHPDLRTLKYDVLQNLARSHGDENVAALVSEIALEARSLPDNITNPAAWIRGRAQTLTSAPAGKKPVVVVTQKLTEADHIAASEERFRKKMANQNKAGV